MRPIVAALLISAFMMAPAPARAQTEGEATPPAKDAAEPGQKDVAKDAFKNAHAAYKKKRYQEALDGFQVAFEADPRPEMLYNIGLCQHKLGQLETARDTFRRFIEQKPKSKARPKVEEKIKEIEAELARRKKRDRDRPPPRVRPAPPPPPPAEYNRTGLQLQASLGLGAFTRTTKDSKGNDLITYTPSLAVGIGIFHRPLRFLSYGARLDWSAVGASPASTPTTNYPAWFIEAAALAHFYPLGIFLPHSRFDPFVGLGVGYARTAVDMNGSMWTLEGPTLHISLGLNVFLNRWIGVGLVMSFKQPFWLEYCLDTAAGSTIPSGCTDVSDVDADTADSLPGMFIIGAEGSFHFF
jgi:hypothetical protein